jgi:hypothetical protein
MSIGQLRRLQWAVRATLTVGVAASVCANVLNAHDNPISQAIAAWPPLALLLTVELVSRVPVHRRLLALARIGGTAVIAGIAAYVSYFHMAAVVSHYGEHQPNPYLLPLSVDGLIVVSSVSLVELSGRLRAALDQSALNTPTVPGTRASVPPLGRPATPLAQAPTPEAAPDNEANHAAAPANAAPHHPAPDGPAPDEPAADLPADHDHNGHQPSAPLTRRSPHHDPATTPAPVNTDPDLLALLPAARVARDQLHHQGHSLTRDSLARQLRRDGHTIRTSRVSALLNLLKNETPAATNGYQPIPDDADR